MRITDIAPSGDIQSIVQKMDLDSFESFNNSLRKNISRDELSTLQSFKNEISERMTRENIKRILGTTDYIEVYHGAPSKLYKNIIENGFKLTKGRRSGFLGSEKIVDNLGIFLTDSPKVAHYYGYNREDYFGYEVVSALISSTDMIDLSKLPADLKRLGLKIIREYDEIDAKGIKQEDMWWLLDFQEFVDALKNKGFKGAKFKETLAVRNAAGDKHAFTYCVFDPSSIYIPKRHVFAIRNFYDFLKDNF